MPHAAPPRQTPLVPSGPFEYALEGYSPGQIAVSEVFFPVEGFETCGFAPADDCLGVDLGTFGSLDAALAALNAHAPTVARFGRVLPPAAPSEAP